MNEPSWRRDALAILAISAAGMIGLGIARFAYALVLPDMKASLALTYAQAGWLNTTNALGYLLGALMASRASNRLGQHRAMVFGIMICIAAIGGCAAFTDLAVLNVLRALAGFGAGIAFVAGGVLTARIAARHPDRSSLLLGLFYGGAGLGIVVSGLAAPLMLEFMGAGSWQAVWAVLAAISLALATPAFLGWGKEGGTRATSRAAERPSRMAWILAGYFLFGGGYIAYMTFMIAWLANSGGGAFDQSLLWVIIGLAVLASPFLWSGVLLNFAGGRAFALLCGVTGIGALLPLMSPGKFVALLSGALFGCAFFSVVASTTAFARRNFVPEEWASAVSLLTILFGVGQMAGPVLVGWLNDFTGGLSTGLYASAGLLLLGAGVAMLQKDFGDV